MIGVFVSIMQVTYCEWLLVSAGLTGCVLVMAA